MAQDSTEPGRTTGPPTPSSEMEGFQPILIRYDGLDAGRHEIEMGSFAESLKGLSRILAVTANFAGTQRWVQHKDAMDVRILVRSPESHCFEIVAWAKWAAEEPLISTVAGGLMVALVGYVFKRASGKSEEMRYLKDSLDQAIRALGTRDQSAVDRMLTTIEKMADALRPAARAAVEPIGKSAQTLSIGSVSSTPVVKLDVTDRDAIRAATPVKVGAEQTFQIFITELDLQNGSCRVHLQGDEENRITAQVTDPQIVNANNPYVIAMAAMQPIRVKAKAALKDETIEKLYISDVIS